MESYSCREYSLKSSCRGRIPDDFFLMRVALRTACILVVRRVAATGSPNADIRLPACLAFALDRFVFRAHARAPFSGHSTTGANHG